MLKALREKRATLVAQMRAILEKAEKEDRDLNAEELAEYEKLKGEKAALDARLGRAEDLEASTAHLDAVIPARSRRAGLDGPVPDVKKEFASIGEFVHAVRFNPNDQRLDFHEGVGAAGDESAELRSEQRMDDGPSGGFALPPQFRQQLLSLTPQQAIIRPRATVLDPGTPPDGPVTMPALDQSGAAPANWFGGVQVQWINEGALKPDTGLALREITWTPHEVAGTITITDKLLRNWQAASSLLEQQLRGAVAQAEDFAFLIGSGAGKPLGILNSGATYKVPRTTANLVKYLDLVNMEARLIGPGVFCYSRSILPQLRTLQDPQGHYIWQPSATAGQPPTLLGYPALENNRNPALGTYGDIWLADLGRYVIKDGSGPYVAASEHVYFTTNKTVIKIFWNVDGAPWLTAPVQLENGWQASPFVALDVPGS